MLDLERSLRGQLEDKEIAYESRAKQLQKELNKTLEELDRANGNLEECKELLLESQSAFDGIEEKINKKDSQIQKLESTIREQKKCVESLENEKLYATLNGFNNHLK